MLHAEASMDCRFDAFSREAANRSRSDWRNLQRSPGVRMPSRSPSFAHFWTVRMWTPKKAAALLALRSYGSADIE